MNYSALYGVGSIFPIYHVDFFHTNFKLAWPSLELIDFAQTFPVASDGLNEQICGLQLKIFVI